MGCCGQKRAELKNTHSTPTTPPVVERVQNAPERAVAPGFSARPVAVAARDYSSVKLRYSENSPVRVRGPVTGRQYDFSGTNPVQSVDARDAEALMRTRFFQRHNG